jgi:hypothetical protein
VTSPTAPAVGVHLPWARVPEPVRAWAAGVGGGVPEAVRDLAGGFSPGATAVLECAERDIFVKAVGAALNPDSPSMHRREAVVSAALPDSPRFPRLLDTYDDGAWVALAFEAIDGHPPRYPWQAAELETVMAGLSAMHGELTPSPAPSLEPLAVYARKLFGGWSTLAATGAPAVLDPWAAAHLARLAELEAGWPEACAGSTLVHGDVRSDNVLLHGGGVVFVDWPHGAVGNPAFDVIGWAPSVVLEGGPSPEELLVRHEPSRQIHPGVVTVLLAAISGFFVAHSLEPAPPGLPTLRPFQAAQGEVALAWLRRRTGW